MIVCLYVCMRDSACVGVGGCSSVCGGEYKGGGYVPNRYNFARVVMKASRSCARRKSEQTETEQQAATEAVVTNVVSASHVPLAKKPKMGNSTNCEYEVGGLRLMRLEMQWSSV